MRGHRPAFALIFLFTMTLHFTASDGLAQDSYDGPTFLNCFATIPDSTCQRFDFDDSSRIDLVDYAGLQNVFGMDSPPGMAIVPGGAFEMGCHTGTGAICRTNQLPVHEVLVDPFYMDVYIVTNAQFAAYLNAVLNAGLIDSPAAHGGAVFGVGGDYPYCDTTASVASTRITWNGSSFGVETGKEDHPMAYVTWYGAAAFANWRSVQLGRSPCYDESTWDVDDSCNGFRMPTEAQWEFAARGGHSQPYLGFPWGNDIDGSHANYSGSGDPFGVGLIQTTPVGYYDGQQTPAGVDMANGFGLYDMAGNVSQWCFDRFDANYYESSPYHNPTGPGSGGSRVLRGGSWFYFYTGLRCAFRDSSPANQAYNDVGLRLVASK